MAERARALGRRTSLHERTVQQVAAKGVSRRRRSSPKPKPAPVEEILVNPQVWEVARELAGDDPHRIQVLGADSVRVHNSGSWTGW